MLINTHQHGRYKTVRFNSSSFCRTEVSMMEQAISLFENILSIVFQRSSMWPLVSPGKKILSRQWQHLSPLSESCSRVRDKHYMVGRKNHHEDTCVYLKWRAKPRCDLFIPLCHLYLHTLTHRRHLKTGKDKWLEHS